MIFENRSRRPPHEARSAKQLPNDDVEIRVVDRDSGVIRTVMPMETYYGLGIWEHWIAFNNYGMWGDSLIVCDLLEGGFMDAAGHVCPESGCPVPDAGPDGGK
jgi:hypothetical protein